MDDVIALYLADGYEIDAVGNQKPRLTAREVYARVGSVGRSEFFAAAQARLKPELVAEICRFDYEGEEEADYNGTRYAIYRVYAPEGSDRVELYLSERSGIHG